MEEKKEGEKGWNSLLSRQGMQVRGGNGISDLIWLYESGGKFQNCPHKTAPNSMVPEPKKVFLLMHTKPKEMTIISIKSGRS